MNDQENVTLLVISAVGGGGAACKKQTSRGMKRPRELEGCEK